MYLILLTCLLDPLVADAAVVDRGAVRAGPPLVQTFQLTNRAGTPIELTGVQSTCGCLAPKLDRTRLAAGESAKLSVEVNTLSQPAGPVSWITHVGWKSADAHGDLAVTLLATLTTEVRVEPAALAFLVRQARSVEVTVTDTRGRPFHITGVGATLPQLSAEVKPGGDVHVHTIRVTAAADGPAGVHSAVLWFTTDDPLYPQVRVPVTLQVPAKTRVSASPSVVFLAGNTGRFLLKDSQGQPVRVDRIEVEGPIAAAAKGSVIVVRADKSKWDGQPASGRVIVHVAAPVVERIVVNVDLR